LSGPLGTQTLNSMTLPDNASTHGPGNIADGSEARFFDPGGNAFSRSRPIICD
jgi:hypothetical protein